MYHIMRGFVYSLLRHCVDGGLPEVASVRDGRVVHARCGGGVRVDEGLLVHGRGGHDLRRRHLLHRLQRLLALRLVDVRSRAPVGRNLKSRGGTLVIYITHILQIHTTFLIDPNNNCWTHFADSLNCPIQIMMYSLF